MWQAWHIFKKDVLYLRGEIALLFSLALALYWLVPRGDLADAFGLLVVAAAGDTIARLIHAEAIVGQNQFWITRPYRWQSLLAAKLLFIVVFVNLPVMLAQAAILLVRGFPVSWIVPGLLWMQVLALVCVALPLAVLATLTDTLARFFGSILAIALLAVAEMTFGFWIVFTTPPPMEWLRDSILFVTLAVLAPVILYLQYRSRRTTLSRTIVLAVAGLGLVAYLAVPWKALFPIQSRLSRPGVDIQVSSDDSRKLELAREGRTLRFSIPVVISSLPSDVEAEIDGYGASLETADGRTVRLDPRSAHMGRLGSWLTLASNPDIRLRPDLPQFLLDNPGQPLTLHASFYFALFGNARDKTFTLRKTPTDVLDGIQCYDGFMNQLECQSAFRWPARLVFQMSGTGMTPLTRLISYSPFPADLELSPLVRRGTGSYSREPLPEERPVTIEVKEPLAYLRRDVVVRDLHLN